MCGMTTKRGFGNMKRRDAERSRAMKCKKCGHERFYGEQHGPHTGLYCDKCGTWQKWLTESEKRLYGARPEVDLSEVSMLDLVNELKRRLEEQSDER